MPSTTSLFLMRMSPPSPDPMQAYQSLQMRRAPLQIHFQQQQHAAEVNAAPTIDAEEMDAKVSSVFFTDKNKICPFSILDRKTHCALNCGTLSRCVLETTKRETTLELIQQQNQLGVVEYKLHSSWAIYSGKIRLCGNGKLSPKSSGIGRTSGSGGWVKN